MKVAVCIVGYRSADDILRCLGGLAVSDHSAFEVVICENGGPEAFAELVAGLPRTLPGGQAVRPFLAPGNLGFAGGVNVCIAESPDADAWWILNPDTIPEPQALSAMVARLERGGCDAVGGPLILGTGKVQSFGGRWRPWFARAVSIGHGAAADATPDPAGIERMQNYLNGASMLMSRRFVEAAGLMREDYFLYCEEVEWCLRAARAGMKLGFAPQGRVLHYQGVSTGHTASLRERSRLSIYLNERNRLLLTRDLYGLRLVVAAAAALAIATLRYVRGRAWRQLGYAASGWAAGLRNERGPGAA